MEKKVKKQINEKKEKKKEKVKKGKKDKGKSYNFLKFSIRFSYSENLEFKFSSS